MGQNINGRQRSVIIEFLGVPGSGKSTLSHSVADILREMGLYIKEPSYELDHQKNIFVRKTKKLYKAIIHLMSRPVYSMHHILEIVRSDQRHFIETLKLIINLLYISEYYGECRRRSGVYFFDQGFFQWLCSTLYSAQKSSALESNRIYRLIQYSIEQSKCMVISVHADPATAMARMEQRGGSASRLEQLDSKAKLNEGVLQFYRCLLDTERLIQDWSQNGRHFEPGHLTVLKVDNGEGSSLVNNQMIIARSIQKIVRG
jgi:thymidylate kinase